jgi:hypothetical protein
LAQLKKHSINPRIPSIMSSLHAATPVERQAVFDHFYAELAPVLVDFIDALGIEPPQEVLTQAGHYLPYLDKALADMAIADSDDRAWLLVRMMYFIGEYFAQQYGGHWYVEETPGARLFGRCVVGKFSQYAKNELAVDPLEIATAYVDGPYPRQLAPVLAAVEAGIIDTGRAGMH